MNNKRQTAAIERFGWVTKEEPLSILDDSNLNLNITILESVAPFFGYYADEPRGDKPEYLYWLLDQYYTHEKLSRVFSKMQSMCFPEIDAAQGNISVANEYYHVVRMRNLKKYNQIHKVQDYFEDNGIKLKKSSRKIQNQMGIIYLNKFFHFLPIGDGLYREEENMIRGYFSIPVYVSWEDFKTLTAEVKYDTSLMFFDAARVAFMENGKITELVRVYRENLTDEQLKAIRDRYIKLITDRYK